MKISPLTAENLRHYVYAYIDPRDSSIFYVGQGQGNRALDHLDEVEESTKTLRIAALRQEGMEPRIDILSHGIKDEETALLIEAVVIDALWGEPLLTNEKRGNNTVKFGRAPLGELEIEYAAKPIVITEPAMLIRINRLYRPEMTPNELYEATRGNWTCGIRREQAKYAFAVYQGVVREVYEIKGWEQAETSADQASIRWKFTGEVAAELSANYKGGLVEDYFTQGAQLPFTYVNCPDVVRTKPE